MMKKTICLLFILCCLPVSPAWAKKQASRAARFESALLIGPSIDLISGSSSVNGVGVGLVAGAQGGLHFSERFFGKLQFISNRALIKSELPGLSYEIGGTFNSLSFIVDYALNVDSSPFFVGLGVGYVSQTESYSKINNATVTDGRTSFDQSGMNFVLEAGWNWNLNERFFVPLLADLYYYTTYISNGTPAAVLLTAGIGYRF